MKTRDWKDAAELIGIAAIVASLIFVGLQMKQAQEIANADRRIMLVANGIEMNNAINENADIWARGLSGQELSTTEAVIFDNLLENFDSFVFFNWRAAQDTGGGTGATENIAHFSVFLYENPGARRLWESRQEWYGNNESMLMPNVEIGKDYEQLVFGNLNKLDQLQE
jgi:hypothetical protein